MIIKTRKLPATQTDGERMRATAENGATLTIAYPYGALDPGEVVALALARAIGRETTCTRVGDNRWNLAVTRKVQRGEFH